MSGGSAQSKKKTKKAKPMKAFFFGPLALPGVTGKQPCKTQELLSTSAVDFSVTYGTLSSRELNFLNDKIPSRTMYPNFFFFFSIKTSWPAGNFDFVVVIIFF